MDWREYEEAVAMLYEQAEGIGTVTRNARVTDSITGQLRQIDVLVTLTERGHSLSIVIDAKFRASKINVREIESVQSLAAAVNASKAVVVAANGWTRPAERRAAASGVDLKLLTLDEAIDLLVPDKWSSVRPAFATVSSWITTAPSTWKGHRCGGWPGAAVAAARDSLGAKSVGRTSTSPPLRQCSAPVVIVGP